MKLNTFDRMNIIPPVLLALKEVGYSSPTPIQSQAIPVIFEGKDIFGIAQTGTGKTAAFAIPIIQKIHKDHTGLKGKRNIKTLICTPTRELAIQISESFSTYGRHTHVKNTVIFGGVNQFSQVSSLKQGVDVLIATPGRFLDLHNQGYISLDHLETFVLDEADRMLDMGFIHDIKKIISVLPVKRQTLLFSATMPGDILTLASRILRSPVKIEVTPESSTVEAISQICYFVDKNRKKDLLTHLLNDDAIVSALVFTRTKHGADKVVKDLHRCDIIASAIHGNKSQTARQRALSDFKEGKCRVLVATDIAARGIDIDELTHVINYDLPNIPETYIHRIGRTGRAGLTGCAISFCDAEEKPYLKDIQKLTGRVIPKMEKHPFMPEISEPEKTIQVVKKAMSSRSNPRVSRRRR